MIPVLLLTAAALHTCESQKLVTPGPGEQESPSAFPPFITPVDKYFRVSLGSSPEILGGGYHLKISGDVDHPREITIYELQSLEMVEKTVTVECIGNSPNGSLVGTATWKGFRVYDLLQSLGIGDNAKTVKYVCADGYFTFNSLDELKASDVIAALYMNGEPLPAKFGFPLRIIFPGHYGVRQPGWVVEMQVLDDEMKDYWTLLGWDTDTAMAVDSRIFFPNRNITVNTGDTVKVGGAAYGARRIAKVEITLDDGLSWLPATLKDSLDEDFAWVFWETEFIPARAGTVIIRSRATSSDGIVQPESDPDYLDGDNAQPKVGITVVD